MSTGASPAYIGSNPNLTATVDFSKVKTIVDKAVKDLVTPSAVVSVYKKGVAVFSYCAGHSGFLQEGAKQIPVSMATVFDVAEVTQIAATVPLLMVMLEEGRIDLNHRVSRYLPGFNVHGKATVTIGHLLSNTSGLTSGIPYFESITREHGAAGFGMLTNRGAKDYVVNSILRSSLKYPPETRQSYSEQGFILLGAIVELLTGLSLEKAAQKLLYKPLGMTSTSFIDLSMLKRKGLQAIPEVVASMEPCEWRQKLVWGEVFDSNAWAMGGVSGHAGLFSNAEDLQKLGNAYLLATHSSLPQNDPRLHATRLFDPQVVRTFLSGGQFDIPVTHNYGFDTPSRENGLSESGFSDKSFGAIGATGCMLWIDPELDQVVVILANRNDPLRTSRKLAAFRQDICRVVNEINHL
jgi:CubicO group peptidase (beta-lactamase class C family)